MKERTMVNANWIIFMILKNTFLDVVTFEILSLGESYLYSNHCKPLFSSCR